jgi:hypothetical protein
MTTQMRAFMTETWYYSKVPATIIDKGWRKDYSLVNDNMIR